MNASQIHSHIADLERQLGETRLLLLEQERKAEAFELAAKDTTQTMIRQCLEAVRPANLLCTETDQLREEVERLERKNAVLRKKAEAGERLRNEIEASDVNKSHLGLVAHIGKSIGTYDDAIRNAEKEGGVS